MSGHGRYQRGHRDDRKKFGKKDGNEENISTLEEIKKSPVLKAFLNYRNELDKKHDKFERLVKMSRDITIESKRIIFLLHSNVRGSNPTSVLPEAKNRIAKLIETVFFNISEELDGEDPYQFKRAYYAGLQEFVEACTFYHFLDSGKLCNWEDLQNDMIYKPRLKSNDEGCDDKDIETVEVVHESINVDEIEKNEPAKATTSNESDANEIEKELKVLLSPVDYVLGVEDLTGELMRHCINSLSAGQVDAMYRTCVFVRKIYSGLSASIQVPSKEFYRKLTVLRQSLSKIENACYMVRVRGSEIPKHMLADVVSCQDNAPFDEDEGFC